MSCNNPKESPPDPQQLAFRKFVARQNFVDLPLHFDFNNMSDSLTQPMIVEDSDTLFIPTDLASGRIWGIYKDTSKYFMFINLGAASVYIPEIMIYDKLGNRVAYEQLLLECGGADCGYYCSERSQIFKDRRSGNVNFSVRDTILYYTCDSVGKEVPGSKMHYTKLITGVVDSTGLITTKLDSTNLLK